MKTTLELSEIFKIPHRRLVEAAAELRESDPLFLRHIHEGHFYSSRGAKYRMFIMTPWGEYFLLSEFRSRNKNMGYVLDLISKLRSEEL
jgi:hypothetical protein